MQPAILASNLPNKPPSELAIKHSALPRWLIGRYHPTCPNPPPGDYTFTAYVAALSDTPQQVTINMSQGDPSGFAIDTGNGLQAFNGGWNLTVAPGEDSVTFGSVNTSAVAQPEAVKLTATITDPV